LQITTAVAALGSASPPSPLKVIVVLVCADTVAPQAMPPDQ
jgi:hypothetical protein